MSLSDCPSCWETPCVCTPAERFAAETGLKNFHRSLCARFGYLHDDKFWWRDLVSLEEHIASLVRPALKPITEFALRDELQEIPLCYPYGTGKKLVRGGSLRGWVSTNQRTGAATLLADLNQNYVNSTIAATIRALIRVNGNAA